MSTLSHHESSGTSSLIDEGWVSWFCGLNGNHVFCEVEKQFMEDSFNLFGLKQYVAKDFTRVMNTILDQIGAIVAAGARVNSRPVQKNTAPSCA